jgi:hypothetical protein
MWFHLLPYVEQDNVYKNNVHNAVVPSYLAPSDPYVSTTDGKLNFAGNIRLFAFLTLGAANANNAVNPSGAPNNVGLQGSGAGQIGGLTNGASSGLTLARIPDGTSNVFMLATRYADCGTGSTSTYYSAGPNGGLLTTGGSPASSLSTTNLTATAVGGFFGGGLHNTPADRSTTTAIFQVAPKGTDCSTLPSVFGQSFSAGGMTAALADASVRSVDPNMSTTTFCRALCPGDGFPLDADWNEGN